MHKQFWHVRQGCEGPHSCPYMICSRNVASFLFKVNILYYHYCTCCVFGEIKLLKKKGSWGQHGAHLGRVGPDELHGGTMNLAIRAVMCIDVLLTSYPVASCTLNGHFKFNLYSSYNFTCFKNQTACIYMNNSSITIVTQLNLLLTTCCRISITLGWMSIISASPINISLTVRTPGIKPISSRHP